LTDIIDSNLEAEDNLVQGNEEKDFTASVLNEEEAKPKKRSYKKKAAPVETEVPPSPESDGIIRSSSRTSSKKNSPSMNDSDSGVIGSRSADANVVKTSSNSSTSNVEKVAIFSEKNAFWGQAGKIHKGYNIVTKAQSEKWLTKNYVRIATPQEIAQELKG
jgi:hypothetical protein